VDNFPGRGGDWPEELRPEELDRNWRYPLLKPERLSENLKAAER